MLTSSVLLRTRVPTLSSEEDGDNPAHRWIKQLECSTPDYLYKILWSPKTDLKQKCVETPKYKRVLPLEGIHNMLK